MSEEATTDTYTVSFKTSGGYDASLIVVRGDTVQELADNITALHEDLVELVVDTENLVHVAYTAKVPTTASQAASEAPQAASQPDSGVTHLCTHGKRQRRESKPGAAKAWVGYFCPQPKGAADQCKPVWED